MVRSSDPTSSSLCLARAIEVQRRFLSLTGLFQGDSTVVGTSKLRELYERFEEELGKRQERAKEARPKWEPPKTKLDEDPGGWRKPRGGR